MPNRIACDEDHEREARLERGREQELRGRRSRPRLITREEYRLRSMQVGQRPAGGER